MSASIVTHLETYMGCDGYSEDYRTQQTESLDAKFNKLTTTARSLTALSPVYGVDSPPMSLNGSPSPSSQCDEYFVTGHSTPLSPATPASMAFSPITKTELRRNVEPAFAEIETVYTRANTAESSYRPFDMFSNDQNVDAQLSPMLECEVEVPAAADAEQCLPAAGDDEKNCFSLSYTAGVIPTSCAVNSYRSSMQQIENDIRSLADSDAVFVNEMEFVLTKSIRALDDPRSVYCFRDFAGHFTNLLDRFGPGGYDSHRAPQNPAWMFKLLEPWMDARNFLSGNREVDVSNYTEINGWIHVMIRVLGNRCRHVVFNENTWMICVEQMANIEVALSKVACDTAKTIIQALPIDDDMVQWVVSMRTMTFGYDRADMNEFRSGHYALLNELVVKMSALRSRTVSENFEMYLAEIIAEFERAIEIELDLQLAKLAGDYLKCAVSVYESMTALTMNCSSFVHEDATVNLNTIASRNSSALRNSIFLSRQTEPSTATETESLAEVRTNSRPNGWHRFVLKLSRAFKIKRKGPQTIDEKDVHSSLLLGKVKYPFPSTFCVPQNKHTLTGI